MSSVQNYFTLFNLPQQFDVDPHTLRQAYRSLLEIHHPDKFVNASDASKRKSAEQAARINDAYSTLTEPVKRAKYLLGLLTDSNIQDNNLATEPAFLMQQIEQRERIENFVDSNGSYDELMALLDQFQDQLDALGEAFKVSINEQNWPQASVLISKMQLFAKLLSETSELEDSVE